MQLNIAEQRQQAHLLLDGLPDEKLAAVHGLLEAMHEPLARALAVASVEDEDLNANTVGALQRAGASLNRGEGTAHEEVMREFGL
jgi:hypothetical protein